MWYFNPIGIAIDVSFCIQMLLAEALMVFSLEKRDNFILRLTLCVLGCFIVAALIPSFLGNIFIAILRFFIIFCATMGLIVLCFKCKILEALFCGIAAYTIQHLSNAVFLCLFGFCVDNLFGTVYYYLLEYCVFAVVYFLCFILFVRKVYRFPYRKSKTIIVPSIILLVSSVVINLYMFMYDKQDPVIIFYPIVCCIILLYLLFVVQSNNELQAQNKQITYMMEKDKKYYEMYKENLNILNVKLHDLKHIINKLGKEHEGKYLNELNDSVKLYENMAKTGNEAVDLVLTEKKFICENRKIKFTYMFDGALLSFMAATDVYALMGNMLDNAIESVTPLQEEWRIINLSAKKRDNLVCIDTENYCGGSVTFNGGLPQTTKQDKTSHGFGIKSMKMIAEKYGGVMHINTQDNIFHIGFIFPIK